MTNTFKNKTQLKAMVNNSFKQSKVKKNDQQHVQNNYRIDPEFRLWLWFATDATLKEMIHNIFKNTT